jgi:hypothetical protein
MRHPNQGSWSLGQDLNHAFLEYNSELLPPEQNFSFAQCEYDVCVCMCVYIYVKVMVKLSLCLIN